MRWFFVLPVFAVVPIGFANTIARRWDDTRVKHSWGSIPEKWEYHGHPPDHATIDLRVALKPHRDNALVDALYEVSNPEHPKCVSVLLLPASAFTLSRRCIGCHRRYGAHLSKEQVAELVAPHPDTVELIGSWLGHHDVPTSLVSISHGGSWLTLSGVPVAQADALLGASYRLYRHTETHEVVLRTISYALPAVLHERVQTVAPTTYFGSPRALRQTSRLVPNGPTLPKGDLELQNASTDALGSGTSLPLPDSCSRTITPRCLRRLYKTERYVPRVPGKNRLGIAGYLGESASQSDLKVFMTLFRPRAVGAGFSVKSINGGINDQSNPGSEVRTVLPAGVYVTQACNPTG
jgi:tripeptidyl-peptidase I